MAAGVIQLKSPVANGSTIIDLSREGKLTQALVIADSIEPLTERKTLHLPLGNLIRTWTIQGYLDVDTYHAKRKALDDAGQDWWLSTQTDQTDTARLIWGEETEGGADYEFDVAIVSIVYTFDPEMGGTATKKFLEFVVELQEAPPPNLLMGRLNV